MKSQIINQLRRVIAGDQKRYGRLVGHDGQNGFSEDALQGLADLDARIPPPDAIVEPASPPSYVYRERLSAKSAAGGGLVKGDDGAKRPHYWGHRERLRIRFLKGGHEPMPEYELLELLLFNAIPRIDVKPLAKRLLAEFGDLNSVIAASKHRVLQVEGANDWVYYHLRVVEAFGHRMAQAQVMKRDVMSSWEDLVTYCRTAMAHREIEQFRVLYLDRKNVLIADEEQARGTVDHVPVYPREVVKRALELNASSIILVHNHPSGDPTPSKSDITMTERIQDACSTLGILVHDHVIIGKKEEFSFGSSGLLLKY
ncbi:DNA repair protein RadC [Ruegeria atlantica]|uniref:DNA repair protein RadC n=1 Tax=Ruegeria atlantica TaxID=81569 RepID=A0AA91C035_9RHOB|nr:DNA repair protein RadC [Ruegeria atlantica]NOE18881.1 DNA repair protein RadC [Ruegeria atlantica]